MAYTKNNFFRNNVFSGELPKLKNPGVHVTIKEVTIELLPDKNESKSYDNVD